MKIAFNPSTVAALTTPPNNKDITFDLRGRNIFARGVKFYGTDTNTWRDIKINNVSIGSHTLDLQNGSNTTLTNTNGIVTINSTWRPVVDNLTSDSTTSSLSAKQGKVLKALIDDKSNSDHNHDGRYLRLSGQDTMQGNLYLHSHGTSYIGKGLGDKSGADFTEANIVIRSWWGISFKSYDDIVRTYIDTRTGNIGTKGVLNAVGAVIQGRVYNGGDDEGIIINPASNGYAGLILGTHNGERSVFYLKKGNPFWRYNNGSTNLDIYHPKKSGTIALTSDIPNKDSWNYDDRYLKLTGGWMSGDINFGGDYKIYWGRNTDSASISFKNDGDEDANSYMSFVTSDNGNEYFRWSHSSGSTNTEWMALRSDGLRVRGTKVSLEGHTHDDRYYTKAESNAKYITDITTSVNKLTFTRNGSNIARNITVNVVYSQGNLTNISNKDNTTKASSGLYIYNSYNQVIGTNPYSSVLSINTGGTIQIAGNWGDDYTRNLYWRSQSDRNVADYPWKSWRTILDSENYSSTLDSRYYTESEVNSLLSRKLDRVNLTTGSWNPRGWNLAADYHYNGGDLSISENNGKMYISVDGCFWQNEGQYRVLDTSDIGDIRDSVTLHQYLSATDAAWYPLVWGGASHNNTSDSTGPIYKSYDKLCWQTSSQTLYTTHLQTTDITFPNSGTSMRGIQGTVGDNDAWRIKGGATASNSGYLEIATADDGNEPIYVRQYTGTFSTIKRTLTLLDTNGFAHFPSYINIGGNENNNSSPDRVWGSNSSDSYLRSYRTSALRVAYAVNANSATTASSANKLTTARNIALGMDLRGSANFDGSGNITINANINACTIGVGSTNGLPFKRIAHFETGGSWNDNALLLYISQGYINGSNGICRVEFRTDNISSSSTSIIASAAVRWLVRNGYGLDSLYAGYYVTAGKAYIDIYLKTTSGYQGTVIRVLQDSRGGINSNVQLINSYYYSDTNHKEAYNSIEAASTALYNRAYTRIVSGSDIGTVSYSNSAGNANTLDGIDSTRFLRQVVVPNNTENDFNTFSNMTLTGRVDPTTGASLKNAPWSGSGPAGGYGVLTYLFNGSEYGTQMAWGYSDNRIYIRNRYWDGSGGGTVWRTSWDTLALTSDIPTVTNYYWANVKISASSSTTTSPTVLNLTATNSIRMGNILLEHTNEINNSANDSIHLNLRNSGNVSLCVGGGKVGIGTMDPSQELYVLGYTHTKGFGLGIQYLSDIAGLLPTISPGDGHTYKCLEIGRPTKVSCIIADKAPWYGTRGILLKFTQGFNGQIVLLKDLEIYGSGNGYFWVMPSGCTIINADNSNILLNQYQISNIYDDGRSRFLIYSSKYSAWIEFLCGNVY